jgi:DNA invertase Pin-like site-specific DNA recombinase
MSETIGYIRVSTRDQNLDMQRDAMAAAGVTKIFEDEGFSGSKASRPGLDAAVAYMREGDVLTVWRLDRLGRSTVNVLTLIKELKERGIGFRSLTEGMDTTGIYGELLLTIVSALAENELMVLRERTRIGLESARSRGKVGGRKPSLTYTQKTQLMKLYRAKSHTIKEIAVVFSISEPTAYRAIAEMKKAKK